jgi:hypothetical protein
MAIKGLECLINPIEADFLLISNFPRLLSYGPTSPLMDSKVNANECNPLTPCKIFS